MASVRQMSCHVILKLPLSLVYLLAFCIKLDVYTFNESLGSDIVGFLVVFTRFFHMWPQKWSFVLFFFGQILHEAKLALFQELAAFGIPQRGISRDTPP